MEMISIARYKFYHNKWLTIGDFHEALARLGYLPVTSKKPVAHPLLRENSSGRAAVLAIGSTRGLCGAYNNFVFQLLEVHINQAKGSENKLDIYVPESKLIGILNYHGVVPTKVYTDFGQMPSDEQINQLADQFADEYIAGKLDYLGVVYMRFFSLASQQAQTLTIMPLVDLIDDLATAVKVIWPWDYTFEDFYLSPPANEAIEALASMIMRSSIKYCFAEAALSEHVARMIVMRNATDNAGDMIEELTAEYNRARQTRITSELLDIIGGTGALE
jgi:F-type H+-transporting ATPase subunit gamma